MSLQINTAAIYLYWSTYFRENKIKICSQSRKLKLNSPVCWKIYTLTTCKTCTSKLQCSESLIHAYLQQIQMQRTNNRDQILLRRIENVLCDFTRHQASRIFSRCLAVFINSSCPSKSVFFSNYLLNRQCHIFWWRMWTISLEIFNFLIIFSCFSTCSSRLVAKNPFFCRKVLIFQWKQWKQKLKLGRKSALIIFRLCLVFFAHFSLFFTLLSCVRFKYI